MKITVASGQEKVVLTSHPYHLASEVDLSGLSANLNMIDTNRDGSQYINTVFNNRDVAFTGYISTYGMDEKNIQQYKNKLFRVWNPKQCVTVTFETEDDYYQITGYPISFPVFQTGFENKNNRFHRFLLDISCNDPFIYRKKKMVTFSQIQPLFSFPMTFTEVNFGERNETLIQSITNNGVMSCPLEITMKSRGVVVNPYLMNLSNGEKLQFETSLQTGEEIYINTGATKEVSKIANGRKQNFYFALTLDSNFMQLDNIGDNVMRFGSEEGEEFMVVEISYRERLGGI